MSTTSELPNYRVYDRTSGGVTHDIHADSIEDAIEAGRDWIEGGDWEPSTHVTKLECEVGFIVRVKVVNGQYTRPDGTVFKIDEDGDLYSEPHGALYSGSALARDGDIDTEATDFAELHDCSGEAPLIESPDCVRDEEHEWKSPYKCVGGIRENPGVWGSGHGTVSIKEVCRHCGTYRITDHGATDSSNGQQCTSVTYEDADEASLDCSHLNATRNLS